MKCFSHCLMLSEYINSYSVFYGFTKLICLLIGTVIWVLFKIDASNFSFCFKFSYLSQKWFFSGDFFSFFFGEFINIFYIPLEMKLENIISKLHFLWNENMFDTSIIYNINKIIGYDCKGKFISSTSLQINKLREKKLFYKIGKVIRIFLFSLKYKSVFRF